ncbi:DUF748 domain-containing protein [Marinobacter arenosus]|uniref:DUF748 domain-containing protein n=1 Tax=Marinobacter arenosus TaxID=2856822 RepID=UPI001C4B2E06|nr:DUF748 domain-containing protein [Marinobacter arenosus]MBW0148247.1 DUF748 domain-containing protein [Marinobacter arenosus]
MAASRQPNRLVRNLLIGLLALVVLYGIAGFLLLPWWLERTLPDQLNERMGWQSEVAEISVNPFALSVEASGLSARDSDDERVVAFDRLAVNLNFFQLVRGIVGFEAIELQEPFIRLDLLDDYGVNFARDWQNNNPASEPPAADPGGSEEDAEPPRFYFTGITIEGGELLFRDFSKAESAEFRITPLDLSLNDLATWRRDGQDSSYSLQAAIGDESLEWQGELSVTPLYSSGTISISGIGYQTLEHFLAPYLPYDLRGGRVSLQSEYELQAGDMFLLATRNGTLSLEELAVAIDAESEEARLTSGTISVDQIGFDLSAREASVGMVSLTALELAVARDENGVIDWLVPLTTGEDAQTAPEASEPPAASGGPAFHWSVEGITLSEGRVQWQDRQTETPADLTLEQLSLTTGALSHRLDEPVNYQLQATLASGGSLSLDGQLTPQPFTLEAGISGSGVALAAFEPYVQEGANLSIAEGILGVDGNLDLDGQQEPLTGTFSGTAEVAGLSLAMADDSGRLLSWQSLRLSPIEYNVNPARLEIGTVTLTQPSVNVVRATNNVHNLERIVRSGNGGPTDQGTDGNASGEDPGFIFRIGQLMLEQGEIAYTDRSISPAFTTSFDELNGSVTGLSNIPPQQGKVDIRGRVGEVATVEFAGTLGTLGTDDVSDLKLTMNDVSLPALSPYFGRYIGYGVDSGKLDLDLNYEIAGTRLDAHNLVVMDRLELGQAVASDDAVDAPVALGLALLRDRDGVIEVDLPISGDLSDPDFSLGQVIMRAFVNLLVKAAASPFSMLGSIAEMAGLSSDELGQVGFQPGSVALAEGEPAKLAALADGLLERPDLLLNVRGGVAPEADGLALLRDELTAGGQKSLTDEEWETARQAYLAGERQLPPEALSNLASARGVAVRKVLLDTHKVPADQLFMLDPSRDASVDENGAVTVQFTLDVR